MDLEIYVHILQEGGIDPFAVDRKKKRKYPVEHDIFKGKTIWVGKKTTDFKLFVASFHPMLGLFMSCPHHPYTKRKRLVTLFLMLCVGSLFAGSSCILDLDTFGGDVTSLYIWKLVISTANAIVLTLEECCLRNLQSCKCRENTQNCCCNWCMKICMKLGVGFWGCIATLCVTFIMIMVIGDHKLKPFLGVFVLQFLISWILQIGGLYIKFRAGWRKDQKMMDQLRKSELFMEEDDALSDHSNSLQRFTHLLKRKKKFQCPYYVTYEDSNRWIERHPEYLVRKERKSEGKKIPLLSGMFHKNDDISRQRMLSTSALPDFSDSDEFMDSEFDETPQPTDDDGPTVYRISSH